MHIEVAHLINPHRKRHGKSLCLKTMYSHLEESCTVEKACMSDCKSRLVALYSLLHCFRPLYLFAGSYVLSISTGADAEETYSGFFGNITAQAGASMTFLLLEIFPAKLSTMRRLNCRSSLNSGDTLDVHCEFINSKADFINGVLFGAKMVVEASAGLVLSRSMTAAILQHDFCRSTQHVKS